MEYTNKYFCVSSDCQHADAKLIPTHRYKHGKKLKTPVFVQFSSLWRSLSQESGHTCENFPLRIFPIDGCVFFYFACICFGEKHEIQCQYSMSLHIGCVACIIQFDVPVGFAYRARSQRCFSPSSACTMIFCVWFENGAVVSQYAKQHKTFIVVVQTNDIVRYFITEFSNHGKALFIAFIIIFFSSFLFLRQIITSNAYKCTLITSPYSIQQYSTTCRSFEPLFSCRSLSFSLCMSFYESCGDTINYTFADGQHTFCPRTVLFLFSFFSPWFIEWMTFSRNNICE